MREWSGVQPVVVVGDLLDQPADAIVNAWNRNIIPWFLLLPQGVSGALKRRAGLAPFWELLRQGPIPLGQAVATCAGRLPYRYIIHVAGINMLWMASARSIADSVTNSVRLAETLGLATLAMPIIGAGSGSFRPAEAEMIILDTLAHLDSALTVTVVRYR
jgi:O-acetyl-ADP-ribose deacetylase (regulator of RNase III)